VSRIAGRVCKTIGPRLSFAKEQLHSLKTVVLVDRQPRDALEPAKTCHLLADDIEREVGLAVERIQRELNFAIAAAESELREVIRPDKIRTVGFRATFKEPDQVGKLRDLHTPERYWDAQECAVTRSMARRRM
jgi:hypothetical protein